MLEDDEISLKSRIRKIKESIENLEIILDLEEEDDVLEGYKEIKVFLDKKLKEKINQKKEYNQKRKNKFEKLEYQNKFYVDKNIEVIEIFDDAWYLVADKEDLIISYPFEEFYNNPLEISREKRSRGFKRYLSVMKSRAKEESYIGGYKFYIFLKWLLSAIKEFILLGEGVFYMNLYNEIENDISEVEDLLIYLKSQLIGSDVIHMNRYRINETEARLEIIDKFRKNIEEGNIKEAYEGIESEVKKIETSRRVSIYEFKERMRGKKFSNNKKREYENLIMQGKSKIEIAEEFKVDVKTIMKYFCEI